jgi:hypothetical protein
MSKENHMASGLVKNSNWVSLEHMSSAILLKFSIKRRAQNTKFLACL